MAAHAGSFVFYDSAATSNEDISVKIKGLFHMAVKGG